MKNFQQMEKQKNRGFSPSIWQGRNMGGYTLLDKQTMEEYLVERPKDEILSELQEYIKKIQAEYLAPCREKDTFHSKKRIHSFFYMIMV